MGEPNRFTSRSDASMMAEIIQIVGPSVTRTRSQAANSDGERDHNVIGRRLLALLLAQAPTTRIEPPSHTFGAATADRIAVPQTCQIERDTKPTCGHSRSRPSVGPGPELAHVAPRSADRPLELVVRGADRQSCGGKQGIDRRLPWHDTVAHGAIVTPDSSEVDVSTPEAASSAHAARVMHLFSRVASLLLPGPSSSWRWLDPTPP
jgi:hypothetical protein